MASRRQAVILASNKKGMTTAMKMALFICVLLIIPAYGAGSVISLERPRKTPYYYNETSVTEMDQDARYSLRRARERTGIE